jgi:hypothetical protein
VGAHAYREERSQKQQVQHARTELRVEYLGPKLPLARLNERVAWPCDGGGDDASSV